MTPQMPWIKLPDRFSGFFLIFQVGLFIVWFYDRSSGSSNPIPGLFLISFIGMIVGLAMYYWVMPPCAAHPWLRGAKHSNTNKPVSNSHILLPFNA